MLNPLNFIKHATPINTRRLQKTCLELHGTVDRDEGCEIQETALNWTTKKLNVYSFNKIEYDTNLQLLW